MTLLGALMGFSLFLGSAGFSSGNAAAPSPAVPALPSHSVTLTAYNAVAAQTDDNPFETASGAYSNPEVVAARSVDLAEDLPFGTIIEFDGSDISEDNTCGFGVVASRIGYRVIADSMNSRFSDRVDVLFGTDANYAKTNGGKVNAAKVLGICNGVTVRVVGQVDIAHMPKTQAELAALVKGTTNSPLAVR